MDSGNVRFKMAKQKTVDECEMKKKESNCVTIPELLTELLTELFKMWYFDYGHMVKQLVCVV